MRIAIDARALGGKLTGDRTYWRGLIGGLAEIDKENEYLLFVRSPLVGDDAIDLPDSFQTVVIGASSERTWSLIEFGKAVRKMGADLAHVQYTVPPGLNCKTVTTVHDISFRLFPKLFSLKDRLLLNLSVPGSIRRADAVLTVSESSRRDILKAYPFLSPSKITATPLAAGNVFRPLLATEQTAAQSYLADRYQLEREYVLSVGVLQPRKNLPLLIRAFRRAKSRAGFPHTLAVAGKIGWLSSETEAAIARAGNDVRMLGYVPDRDLPLLYGSADLMAYPSLYEGFGLPPLEAMACGCPVLASNNSSLPEVIGDAGTLLPATVEPEWEEALIRIIESASLRSKMRTLGIGRASQFSWLNTASQTLQVYKCVFAS
jgi:glycosyltransferase involved in cell wall biosynthesis